MRATDSNPAQLRAVISNLYMLLVQTHDYQGPGTQQAMQGEMYDPRKYRSMIISCLTAA